MGHPTDHPATTLTVTERGDGLYTHDIATARHHLVADEPESMGGRDLGPAPYEFLLSALGACTAMTLRMYANQKNWALERVTVRMTHHKKTGDDGRNVDLISREIAVTGTLDAGQRARLLEIANRCPVHRTLENPPLIESLLVEQL